MFWCVNVVNSGVFGGRSKQSSLSSLLEVEEGCLRDVYLKFVA